jgi:hypothetical protein
MAPRVRKPRKGTKQEEVPPEQGTSGADVVGNPTDEDAAIPEMSGSQRHSRSLLEAIAANVTPAFQTTIHEHRAEDVCDGDEQLVCMRALLPVTSCRCYAQEKRMQLRMNE